MTFRFGVCMALAALAAGTARAGGGALADGALLPDVDATRRERIGLDGERFLTPAGFRVEQVAEHELTGSLIDLTFDPDGRPFVSREGAGPSTLLDTTGDGRFDTAVLFTDTVRTSQGMLFLDRGDVLLQGQGPDGPGLYRVQVTDDDETEDAAVMVGASAGGIAEHGPHAVHVGPDGYFYVLYGNHAAPAAPAEPRSPLGETREDHLLPAYVDPRGHATRIRAPGGVLFRVDPSFTSWSRVFGGMRNAYDFDLDHLGEIFTFDSDMEWDIGLPWFRPVRVMHGIPGGDYGWRTGSKKMPFHYIDTLPSIDDVGRGSPVGVRFYAHNIYPERFHGAFFMGDWSRGRIRVLFPERAGASYAGQSLDFVIGEPLNVTGLAVGPDGFLYFTTGGRGTAGGLYRVTYEGAAAAPPEGPDLAAALAQPMPRSAWGRAALREQQAALGDAWEQGLAETAADVGAPTERRVRALEYLHMFGPAPSAEALLALTGDEDATVRAAAAYYLGLHPLEVVRPALERMLGDPDPFVARRACEALIRAGFDVDARVRPEDGLVPQLFGMLESPDPFLRTAARRVLERVHRELWVDAALAIDARMRPRAAIVALLAAVYTQSGAHHGDTLLARLRALDPAALDADGLLDFLRVTQLTLLRDLGGDGLSETAAALGAQLLERFPHGDARVNRELQILLAHFGTPGAIPALLDYLETGLSQEEQIHTAYCLRAIAAGWTRADRNRFLDWFVSAWTFRGGASLEGYIDNIWESALAHFPAEEQMAARERKAAWDREQIAAAAALLAAMEPDEEELAARMELAQMSFEELAEYLEYDPMAYRANLRRGKEVFVRSMCANCHIFGTAGRGGGPDLSTVTSRFRRQDILEAIMYPSRNVSDQYQGVHVELDDFSEHSGMVVTEDAETLTLITIHGERLELPRSGIVARRTAEGSMMPEGLLNTMTLRDLVDLINFLERGGDESALEEE